MITEVNRFFIEQVAKLGLSPPLVMGVIQYEDKLIGTCKKYYLGVGTKESVDKELSEESWRVYDANK